MAPSRRPAGEALTPLQLERRLAASAPAPVYIIEGPEAVLRDRALAALKARVVEGGFEAFNYRRLEPGGFDGGVLAEEMRVVPMGAGGRLVVIEPAESIAKEPLKALAAYAAEPSPGTCLALLAGEAKEALRKAFPSAVIVDCSSPWEDRVPDLLAAEARDLRVILERDAGEALAALCGRDLSRAVAELRKAAGRVGHGGRITAALVRDLAGGEEAGDVYRFASCLARGDLVEGARAARRYIETADRGEIRLLYEMGTHLRRLLAARSEMAAGTPPREAARAAGVFWKDVDAFAAELPRWDERRIAAAFRRLLAADRSVKRGIEGGAASIESYLWSLRQEGGPRAADRSPSAPPSAGGSSSRSGPPGRLQSSAPGERSAAQGVASSADRSPSAPPSAGGSSSRSGPPGRLQSSAPGERSAARRRPGRRGVGQ